MTLKWQQETFIEMIELKDVKLLSMMYSYTRYNVPCLSAQQKCVVGGARCIRHLLCQPFSLRFSKHQSSPPFALFSIHLVLPWDEQYWTPQRKPTKGGLCYKRCLSHRWAMLSSRFFCHLSTATYSIIPFTIFNFLSGHVGSFHR